MWNTKNTKPACILSVLLICYLSTFSQSPPNPSSDFSWNSSTTAISSSAATISDIQNAFNNGRRNEEIQKMLSANVLGNLILPSNFLTLSKAQKVLFLLNAERNCRAGIDYDGSGGIPPVLGLSVDGVDMGLTTVAQNHADWLLTNNKFQHAGLGNSSPFDRIQAAYGLNMCSEFLSSGENIYLALSQVLQKKPFTIGFTKMQVLLGDIERRHCYKTKISLLVTPPMAIRITMAQEQPKA
jgi:uncharacterized protein YkwD